MTRLDALAIAIARENQSFDPASESLMTLNPGLLKSHSLDRIVPVNENGIRVFSSFQGGYRALMTNLEAKCNGLTRANGGKLVPDSPLSDLLKTFKYMNARNIIEFLQDALEDKAITETTPISFFIEG